MTSTRYQAVKVTLGYRVWDYGQARYVPGSYTQDEAEAVARALELNEVRARLADGYAVHYV